MGKTRTNQQWLSDLNASGLSQEAAILDLRELLLRAALYFFSRNLGDFQGLTRDEILQRAEDCAQDAVIAVIDHLSDFRGDSKFSTWAYKFAINMAMMRSRRERWKGVSLEELAASDADYSFERMMHEVSEQDAPERSAMQSEVQGAIQQVIQSDLTEKQRQVLVMMVFHEVPLDEVALYLGTNRNAIYKMLHDARKKLKAGLEAHGFDVGETLGLFGRGR
jgi:RNA polymerase sigma-70 factor (ECF subfamily)